MNVGTGEQLAVPSNASSFMGPKMLSCLVSKVRDQPQGTPQGTTLKHSQEQRTPRQKCKVWNMKNRKENAGVGELAQQVKALALKA